jgi:AraC family transcriptional regulator, activator of mtrCDE
MSSSIHEIIAPTTAILHDHRISKPASAGRTDVVQRLPWPARTTLQAHRSSLNHPILRISPSDLDKLMTTLEVSFVTLSECLVSPGWQLAIPANEMPGVHYNMMGAGLLVAAGTPPISLTPHTLVVVPPRQSFRIHAPSGDRRIEPLNTVEARWDRPEGPGTLRRNVAGDGDPQIRLICGYFRAFYGTSIDLFSSLNPPIVEQFGAVDRLDDRLKTALEELVAQQAGAGAMTAALLKQVLLALVRRSLVSTNLWVERFSTLGDPQVARAFADMVARPGATHSVETLAHIAGLSRSVFMVRFTAAFGRSPMTVLRELRMRQATTLLASDRFSVDQVAYKVGYRSRSSFFRAYRKFAGSDPLSQSSHGS